MIIIALNIVPYFTHDKIHSYKDNYLGIVGSAAHHTVIQSILEKHGEALSFNNQFSNFGRDL